MKRQAIPETLTGRIATAEVVIPAMNKYETQFNFGGLNAKLATAIATGKTARARARDARQAVTAAGKARKAAYDELRKVALVAMGNLRPERGFRWSTEWRDISLKDKTTAVPRAYDELKAFTSNVSDHLAANPDQAIESKGMTVEGIASRQEALTQALAAEDAALAESKRAVEAREAASDVLLTRLQQVFGELNALPPESTVWNEFGLPRPSDPRTPGQVTGVTVEVLGNGQIRVTWSTVPRADRYRVFVTGPQAEDKPVAYRSQDPEKRIDGLEPGVTYKVTVAAVNRTGQGVESEVVTVVVS